MSQVSLRIAELELLGKGGESEVYALDTARVLRIYKLGMPIHYLERRAAFYELLNSRRPPFELPVILESGTIDGRWYTIERRMRGRDFAAVLPNLAGTDRERALTSYLQTAEQIGAVQFPDQPFGEVQVIDQPLQRDTWPQFLRDRMARAYRQSRADVEQDVAQVARLLAYMEAEFRALEGFAAKCLVHGDYFPGNVFIDEQLQVYGVGDFGYTSVVGDPRMDIAGAICYLEVVDGYRPEDTRFLMQLAEERHGGGIRRWIQFYRLYYSFYFSVCKTDDPRTYNWCIRNMHDWLHRAA